MSRKIQVGDFVFVSQLGFYEYYQIISIMPNEIRIASVTNGRSSAIIFDGTRWKIAGTNLNLRFLTPEEYTFQMKTYQRLLEELKAYATTGMEDDEERPLTQEEINMVIQRIQPNLFKLIPEYEDLAREENLNFAAGEYTFFGDAYREGLYDEGVYDLIEQISKSR